MKEGQPATFDELQESNSDKLYQRNPVWQALKGKENRMPDQFGMTPEQATLKKAVEERVIFQQ